MKKLKILLIISILVLSSINMFSQIERNIKDDSNTFLIKRKGTVGSPIEYYYITRNDIYYDTAFYVEFYHLMKGSLFLLKDTLKRGEKHSYTGDVFIIEMKENDYYLSYNSKKWEYEIINNVKLLPPLSKELEILNKLKNRQKIWKFKIISNKNGKLSLEYSFDEEW